MKRVPYRTDPAAGAPDRIQIGPAHYTRLDPADIDLIIPILDHEANLWHRSPMRDRLHAILNRLQEHPCPGSGPSPSTSSMPPSRSTSPSPPTTPYTRS